MLFHQPILRLFIVWVLASFGVIMESRSTVQAQGFQLGYGYGGAGAAGRVLVNQQSNQPVDLADLQNTTQFSVFDYRRMFRNGVTPHPSELVGQWQGVNKGIVELVGYKQFVKDIRPFGNGVLHGDNIQVEQVDPSAVRRMGWNPLYDQRGNLERLGKFAVLGPSRRGFFGQAATFSYAGGGNPPRDPSRLLVDKVVRINEHQMLGRAAAKLGPLPIPLSYFVLERVPGGSVPTIPVNLPTGF